MKIDDKLDRNYERKCRLYRKLADDISHAETEKVKRNISVLESEWDLLMKKKVRLDNKKEE